eukprot:a175626_546.p1 GENE.a175626_546~~a175626_546.p1  ORF type:complete len:520 (-),score=231.03 a175626_546:54-1589(-)
MAASSSAAAVDMDAVKNAVLGSLANETTIESSRRWAETQGFNHDDVDRAIKSLASLGYIAYEVGNVQSLALSDEGVQYAEAGTPEAQLYHAIPADGELPQASDAFKALGAVGKLGLGKAKSAGWIAIRDGKLVRAVPQIDDAVAAQLRAVRANGGVDLDAAAAKELKSRKLVVPVKSQFYIVSRGAGYRPALVAQATDLSAKMLATGEWATASFKPFNFNARGRPMGAGLLHPLLKVRTQFREIFLELGFEEMPTDSPGFVESSFWNFDTLFQGQQHPARDSHDTFFIADPKETKFWPEDYAARVKAMHESGGHGSIGYRYVFSEAEARKNIMRTHTTAVSSRMLYALAQGEFKPRKYFSIDRVFRNESLDSTHLNAFFQVEGLIADRNVTLGDLIGVLAEFFRKLGMQKIRFKPAYNPYTEPSMEIFSYHEQSGRWIEVGNSGVFRPEMLRPMGLPEDVSVIAWGLSLERPTMIKYKIANIRDLVGHAVDLDFVKSNPICDVTLERTPRS